MQRAGLDDAIEFHGSLFAARYARSGTTCAATAADRDAAVPARLACGEPLRRGVVWFEEAIDPKALYRAINASENAAGVVLVGTRAALAPANSLTSIARRYGAWVVETNTAETAMSDTVDPVLRGRVGDILPRLVDRLRV